MFRIARTQRTEHTHTRTYARTMGRPGLVGGCCATAAALAKHFDGTKSLSDPRCCCCCVACVSFVHTGNIRAYRGARESDRSIKHSPLTDCDNQTQARSVIGWINVSRFAFYFCHRTVDKQQNSFVVPPCVARVSRSNKAATPAVCKVRVRPI